MIDFLFFRTIFVPFIFISAKLMYNIDVWVIFEPIRPIRTIKGKEKTMNPPLQSNEIDEIDETEIGIALSYDHNELGSQFLGISINFAAFDSILQYNILQDSISSRTNDLALFVDNKNGTPYTIRIKKFKAVDPSSPKGWKRFTIVLIIPSDTPHFDIEIDAIAEDFGEKISQGIDIDHALKAWYILLNDCFGKVCPQAYIETVQHLGPLAQVIDVF